MSESSDSYSVVDHGYTVDSDGYSPVVRELLDKRLVVWDGAAWLEGDSRPGHDEVSIRLLLLGGDKTSTAASAVAVSIILFMVSKAI